MKKLTIEEIKSFLKDNSQSILQGTIKGYFKSIVKVPYRNNLSAIYISTNYLRENETPNISLENDLKYNGVVNDLTGDLYNIQYELKHIDGYDYNNPTIQGVEFNDAFKEQIEKEVNDYINKKVDNKYPTNIDLSNDYFQKELNDIKEYDAWNFAKNQFFLNKTSDQLKFDYGFYLGSKFNQNICLDYILYPNETIQKFGDEVLSEKSKIIYTKLYKIELAKPLLDGIWNDPNHKFHIFQKIKHSIPEDIKTCNVFILKNGIEWDGKIEASVLRRICAETTYISTYDIAAQDRKKFEQLFTRSADLFPQDIVKITHGKKELYTK